MEHRIRILPADADVTAPDGACLLDVLAANGYALPAACGGRGSCGKCRVSLLQGRVLGTEADEKGEILACRARVCGDLTVRLHGHAGGGLEHFFGEEPTTDGNAGVGVALDVGTTTLALCSVDLKTGRVLARVSALNPQGVLGADVLSRIQACGEGKGMLLQRLLLERVRQMLSDVAVGSPIAEMSVAANTTMLHLFRGVDPTPIGVYPFTPRFTDEQVGSGEELGLPVGRVRLLPSVSGYIGSDITAGVVACGMDQTDRVCLFADVGTNGELVLAHGGRLYAASTAAGPALEGACIECGMGGVSGACAHVSLRDGVLAIETVDETPVRGICGSGMMDLIALLLREGLIGEGGSWEQNSSSVLAPRLRGDRFYLSEDVYLSGRDIRQFQLAKAAIAAGIETLLAHIGLSADAVDAVYVAGGLGYYMNVESAAATGLLPRVLAKKAQSVGNTALAGARLALLQADCRERIRSVAARTEVVELASSPTFTDAYVMNMLFEQG